MTDDEPITEGRWQSRAHGGEIRVMAVVDGWVVARHKGAAPFLCHSSDWAKLYERKEVARAARDEWPGERVEYRPRFTGPYSAPVQP